MNRERLEGRAELFELMAQGTTDLQALFDERFVHVAFNAAYLEACGKPSEEVIGKTAAEVLGSEAADSFVRRGGELSLAGERSRYQCWVEFPRAGGIQLDVVCSPSGSCAGRPSFVLTARVASEREREALEASEALLVATARTAKVGGWQLDAEKLDLHWTEETYRILGVPLEQGPQLEDGLSFFYPDDRPVLEAALKRALEDGEPYDLEQRILTPDGTTRWTRCRGGDYSLRRLRVSRRAM